MRTNLDVKKQEGISFLLMDMNAPGVTVWPIVLLDGQAEVNEVFFDNVRVPVENLVGEVDKGWTYAKYLLTLERLMAMATTTCGWCRRQRKVRHLGLKAQCLKSRVRLSGRN